MINFMGFPVEYDQYNSVCRLHTSRKSRRMPESLRKPQPGQRGVPGFQLERSGGQILDPNPRAPSQSSKLQAGRNAGLSCSPA